MLFIAKKNVAKMSLKDVLMMKGRFKMKNVGMKGFRRVFVRRWWLRKVFGECLDMLKVFENVCVCDQLRMLALYDHVNSEGYMQK